MKAMSDLPNIQLERQLSFFGTWVGARDEIPDRFSVLVAADEVLTPIADLLRDLFPTTTKLKIRATQRVTFMAAIGNHCPQGGA